MRKYPKSTADFQGTAEGLIKGGETNKVEVGKWGLNTVEFRKLLDKFIGANALQEKLKADLHQSTNDLTAVKQDLQKEIARWISTLEGNYGKTGEKLQEFGIAPRMLRPRKGPRAKKA
mgnify:CR=1 FL=1